MLNISAQSDYGILLISHLTKSKGFIPLSELIEKTKLPARYMARIASSLSKAGVLESREGKIGGYKISEKGKKISLYEYLKIFEGDLAIVKCQKSGYECPWDEECQHKGFLRKTLSKILLAELKKFRLLQLFK
ncbi:MAG: Transcriptional regulator, BadM/Rrf2 family [Candidatus Roizmanbacteria bacterium GW2011_GWA2_35_19]|uniref:Transcriptional regulator, BadM/Rrf2 family n=1 Tax=Candidatus Roizmanbacteria bacterium GW2011_GWA2_35_19 TaxID=1618478 RepID=A0A0G0BYQ3_9BACT|nr:MAG: Transcriptional regulator, BadM/Rrf2 family [Candidatus Roizmanbacteria bacterium GW2011_GWA2_35_19]